MRPNKFRAWDKEKKIMYSFDEIMKVKIEKIPFGDDFYFRETYIPPENRRFPWTPTVILQQWYSSNPWLEIMEYTGREDKNGVDIFEYDLLRLTKRNNVDKDNFQNRDYDILFKVQYDLQECAYVVQGVGGDYGAFLLRFFKGNFEVIGNIYENPELLKTQSEDSNEKVKAG